MSKFCQKSVDSRCAADVSAALFTVIAVSLVSVNTEDGWFVIGQGVSC